MLDLQLFWWDEPVGYEEKALLRERVPQSIRKRYEEHAASYGRLVEGIYYRDSYEETAEEEKARRRWPIPEHVRHRVEASTDPRRFYDRILERRERSPEEWNWMDAMEECMEEQTCWTVLLSLLPNLTHLKMVAKETETTPVCAGAVPGSLSKLVWAQVSYGTCRRLSLRKLASLAKAAPNLQTLVIDLPGEPVTSYQSGYGGEHDITQMPVFANVTSLCLCHGFMNMEAGGFKELAACFPRLERLEIVKPEDKVEGSAQLSTSLHELVKHIPKVRDLRLTWGGMADAGADLAPVAASLRALKGLQRLWVSVYSLNLDAQHGLIDVLPSSTRHLSVSVEVYDHDTDALLHAIQELGREAGRSATRFPDLASIAVTDWAFHGPGEGEPWELPPDPERALAVRRVAGILLENGIEFLVEGCRSVDLMPATAQAMVELFGSDQKPDVREMMTNSRPNASYTMAHWGQGWSYEGVVT
jgi:hypothetical protein